MRKYAMETPKHIDQTLDTDIFAVRIVHNDESARENLLVGDDVGSPVEGVTAVVDSTAAFRLLMDGAEELPFGGAHLGTCARTTWWSIKKEAND